jgi:hypothetical protein
MLADLHPGNGRRDRIVVSSCDTVLRTASTLGIKGVDLRHAPAKPNKDHMFRFAWRGHLRLKAIVSPGKINAHRQKKP